MSQQIDGSHNHPEQEPGSLMYLFLGIQISPVIKETHLVSAYKTFIHFQPSYL